MATYDVGDVAILRAAFTALDIATDPTTITILTRSPSGVLGAFTYPLDSEVVRDGVGLYHYNLTIDESGTWEYKWVGTGACQAAEPGSFNVRSSVLD